MALTHLLLVEHCKTATKGNLKHWRVEILAFRDDMGAAVDDAHVLLGEYDRNIAKAWKSARREAVQRLAEYSAQAAGGIPPSATVGSSAHSCQRTAPT